jgi:hypothetical protein
MKIKKTCSNSEHWFLGIINDKGECSNNDYKAIKHIPENIPYYTQSKKEKCPGHVMRKINGN